MEFLTLKTYQTQVDRWVRRYGVRYFDEMTNLAILMEEVGEVARLMARIYGEQSFKESDPAPNDPPHDQSDDQPDDRPGDQIDPNNALADELADVFFVLTCIANQTGVDLTAALERNLDKKSRRDRTRHWNNPKLHP